MTTWIYYINNIRFGKVEARDLFEAYSKAEAKARQQGENPDLVTVRKEA